MRKQILSALLLPILCLSSLTVGAAASEKTEVTESYAEADEAVVYDAEPTTTAEDDSEEDLCADGHTLIFVEEVEPSCEEDGHASYYECTVCERLFDSDGADASELTLDDVFYEAWGHDLDESGDDYENEPATCITEGVIAGTCSRDGCGKYIYETLPIDQYAHSWDEENKEIVTELVECQTDAPGTDGVWKVTCKLCKTATQEVVVSCHDGEVIKEVEATCTTGGYTLERCTICGTEYATDETDALGHDWTDVNGTEVCSVCGATKDDDTVYYRISGTITSYGDANANTTISLYGADETDAFATAEGVTDYSFDESDGVVPGEYILKISKPNHVTREYPLTVSDSDVMQDVTIWLYGDVNTDGNIDGSDATQIYRYAAGKSSIFASGDEETLAYRLKVADVNGGGTVDGSDATQVYRYAAGKTSIFDSLS